MIADLWEQSKRLGRLDDGPPSVVEVDMHGLGLIGGGNQAADILRLHRFLSVGLSP